MEKIDFEKFKIDISKYIDKCESLTELADSLGMSKQCLDRRLARAGYRLVAHVKLSLERRD
jgi:hypothetical protein